MKSSKNINTREKKQEKPPLPKNDKKKNLSSNKSVQRNAAYLKKYEERRSSSNNNRMNRSQLTLNNSQMNNSRLSPSNSYDLKNKEEVNARSNSKQVIEEETKENILDLNTKRSALSPFSTSRQHQHR